VIGKELLHYQVEEHIGSGGMGDVFRARDTKLGRVVAMKILPDIFAQDRERVSRFEREAKMLASLNHANIAALYGLEQAGGKHFLIMELVEGETLGQRIARGPIPVEEALKIALQIAEALEAAHDKGIIHRDLKPSNVKITPEGKVKVLDFGLAKALDSSPVPADPSNSPTMSVLATNVGVILGTAGYMSPEQAKGRAADQRSDVFAFGCVLYEMLTGRLTFEGETVTEVLASVLKQEADFSLLPQNIHSRVLELIRRCLAKDPKKRWHAAADIRVEIETILTESSGLKAPEVHVVEHRPLWKRLVPVVVTAIFVAAVTTGVVWNVRPETRPPEVSRFSFVLPEGQSLTRLGRPVVDISPDGQNIVYVANQQLYLRPISDVDARPINGTNQDVAEPFFSPDGRWIGFYANADKKLKKISINGGTAVTICECEFPLNASWTPDNQILFASAQRGKGIFRVSANGGNPEAVISAKPEEFMAGPVLLPDRDHVLFSVAVNGAADRWDTAKIAVESLSSHTRKILIEGGSGARYLPTGQIMYNLGGSVFVVPFDAGRLTIAGGPVPVIENVERSTATSGAAQMAFADNGSMVYVVAFRRAQQKEMKLAWVGRSGKANELPLPAGTYLEPRISPDGKQIAILKVDDQGNSSLWVYEVSGATAMRRLTFDSVDYPVWTPDSQRIVYKSLTAGGTLFWQRADGNSPAEQLEKTQIGEPNTVSPDGKNLIYHHDGGGGALWLMPLIGDRTPKALIEEKGSPYQSSLSPDGKWIAYASGGGGPGRSGGNQVYVQPFPPLNGVKYQITTKGGAEPLWSPDGKQLFYAVGNAPRSLISVDIRTVPTFAFANPTELPIRPVSRVTGNLRAYDIAPDGKQFLIASYGSATSETPAPPPQAQLRITLNWFEELKQRAR
jgi:serine/threonine-protein kinase